jgi:hypothetical protein
MLEQLGMTEIAHGLLLFCPHFSFKRMSLYLYQNLGLNFNLVLDVEFYSTRALLKSFLMLPINSRLLFDITIFSIIPKGDCATKVEL